MPIKANNLTEVRIMLIESECPLLPDKVRDYDYGGTDVACILGVNKYKSAYNYWLEKTGKIEREPVQNEAVYFGVQQERTIANEYMDRFGDGAGCEFSVKLKKTDVGGAILGGECEPLGLPQGEHRSIRGPAVNLHHAQREHLDWYGHRRSLDIL